MWPGISPGGEGRGDRDTRGNAFTHWLFGSTRVGLVARIGPRSYPWSPKDSVARYPLKPPLLWASCLAGPLRFGGSISMLL